MTYPGNGASQQQIAAWMGAQAKAAGLPPELPVMAALTESTLRNIPYGDHDSVGFFQMRLSIWNSGPYAGYLDNPDLQIKWFIDHALAARAEDPALAQSPSTWGQWIANVEQPAAEYRYRYQLQLGTAQDLLRGADLTPGPAPPGGGVAPSAPGDASAPGAPAGAAAPSAAPPVQIPVGQAALNVGMRLAHGHGDPGAAGSGSGIDGPGLVQRAYEREGINLPPAAAEQFDVGMPVSLHDLRPGDAVFFSDANGYVNHAALYAGNGQIVSAPESGDQVKLYSLSDSPFAGHFIGARRYIAGALADPKHYARTLPTLKG
jgi:cell wall-associated NlpC family hydrolase